MQNFMQDGLKKLAQVLITISMQPFKIKFHQNVPSVSENKDRIAICMQLSSVLCKLAQYYYTKIRQLLMVFVEVFLLELSELRQITSIQRIYKSLHKTATQPLFPQTL